MSTDLITNALNDLKTRATTGKRTLPRNLGMLGPFGGTVTIGGNCLVTGKLYSVIVKDEDLEAYLNMQGYAQELFLYLSADDREFIISGTSPEGWHKVFGTETEEELVAKEEAHAIEIATANRLPEKAAFELTKAEYAALAEDREAW